MKILVAHASNFDYQTELYEPLKRSAIAQEHTLVFPHDEEDAEIETNEHVADSDLLIAEVTHPSIGAGVEIGLAQAAGVRALFLCKKGTKPSAALKFIKGKLIEYTDASDLIAKVEAEIANN